MRAYLALIKIDLKLALRDRSVIFFNYLFPLIFFFVFAEMMGSARGGGIANVVTMVLTIGILGNGLWGAGMRAVQEREKNILRRFKVTPISPAPILVASMVTGWLIYLPGGRAGLLRSRTSSTGCRFRSAGSRFWRWSRSACSPSAPSG